MIKHKNKIITFAIIAAVLATAWFYGGNYNKPGDEFSSGAMAQGDGTQGIFSPESGISGTGTQRVSDIGTGTQGAENTGTGTGRSNIDESAAQSGGFDASQGIPVESYPAAGNGEGNTEPDATTAPSNSNAVSSGTGGDGGSAGQAGTANGTDKPEPGSVQGQGQGTDKTHDQDTTTASGNDGEKDRYQTGPVPEGRPAPAEPEDVKVGDGSFTVYLTVRTDNLLNNMNLLNKEKHELVPDDGVVFPMTAVIAYEGESVFNVLQREMRRNKIHMVSRFTPIYNSAYIEAINNLYEFDAGELSGWMYSVNDWYPNYGCSRYILLPDDVIELHYTCDLGLDLPGANWAAAGQRQ